MASLKDVLSKKAQEGSVIDFDPTGRDEQRLLSIAISSIDPDPLQPRSVVGDVKELTDSILEHGLLQPIIVEPQQGTSRYKILAGHRRFKACQEAGLKTVKCIVRTVEEQSRLALQIIENLHREDISPVDEARSFQRLMDECSLTQRDLAKKLGKSLGSISQTVRILDLSEEILANVQTSEHLSKSVLLEIAKESDPKKQKALFEKARAGGLTVRKAREGTKGGKPKAKGGSQTIKLEGAQVRVSFQKKNPTHADLLEALKEALEKAKHEKDN